MKNLLYLFVVLGILGCTSVKNTYEYKKGYSYEKQITLLKELAESYNMKINYSKTENDVPFSEKEYNNILEVIYSMSKIDGLKGTFHYEADSGLTIPLGANLVKSMFDSVGLSADSVAYKLDSIKHSSDTIVK